MQAGLKIAGPKISGRHPVHSLDTLSRASLEGAPPGGQPLPRSNIHRLRRGESKTVQEENRPKLIRMLRWVLRQQLTSMSLP